MIGPNATQEAADRLDMLTALLKRVLRDLPSMDQIACLNEMSTAMESMLKRVLAKSDEITVQNAEKTERPIAPKPIKPPAIKPPVRLTARSTASAPKSNGRMFRVPPRSIFSIAEAAIRRNGEPMTAAELIAAVQNEKPGTKPQSVYTAISAAAGDGRLVMQPGTPHSTYDLGKTNGTARRAEGGA